MIKEEQYINIAKEIANSEELSEFLEDNKVKVIKADSSIR